VLCTRRCVRSQELDGWARLARRQARVLFLREPVACELVRVELAWRVAHSLVRAGQLAHRRGAAAAARRVRQGRRSTDKANAPAAHAARGATRARQSRAVGNQPERRRRAGEVLTWRGRGSSRIAHSIGRQRRRALSAASPSVRAS
jgi:hypothetical protein